MNNLFPLLDLAPSETTATAQLYRDIRWDYDRNQPVWRNGNPVWVTGGEAVKSWAARTLYTVRCSSDVFSTDYGCDLMTLVGQPYTETVRQSEAVRLIRECLTINPYIKDVQQISVEFSGDTLSISCVMQTVYGEVTVHAAA